MQRSLQLSSPIDDENRTVALSVSSDVADVLRMIPGHGIGYEILDHSSAACIDLSRFAGQYGGPLLFGHDRSAIIGKFLPSGVQDGKLRGTARFAKSPRANEIYQDVRDNVIEDVSISYDYKSTDVKPLPRAAGSDYPSYLVQRWALQEVSMVTVPADAQVGIGRAEVEIEIETEDEVCGEDGCTPETPCPKCKKSTAAAAPAEETGRHRPSMEVEMTEIIGSADQTQTAIVEALQLRAIAENLGKGREASEILAAKPLAEARNLISALLASAPAPVQSMGMSAPEAKEYSYARALQNALLRQEGEKVASTFEDEVALSLERSRPANTPSRGGLLVPLALRTTLTTTGTATGAEAIYTQYGGELIDILRSYAAVIGMGARTMSGLSGSVSFPKQLTDAAAAWVAENPGSDPANTNPTFGTVGLTPKLLLGSAAFSRSLMMQSVFSIEATVRQSLASAHALAIDKAAIHGSGSSNQPLGIYKTTGTNTVAFGGVPTYALLSDMISQIHLDNALASNMGFITTPGIAGKLAQTLESSVAGAKYIWTGDRQNGTVCGYKAASTNQLSATMSTLDATGSTQHGIAMGNWNDLLIGFWGSLELILDPYTLKKQGLVEIATHQMADVAVRHAQSFCVSTGATLA